MRNAALLPSMLLATAIASTGCSTHKTSHAALTSSPMAERGAFVEQRASELVKRGAPRDQAAAQATGEWELNLRAQDDRAAELKRAEQGKLESDLAKMARKGDLR